MRPSSTASNSIVALSVSISASTSPEWTSSPSLTSHLASLPSSMVGDSAGMRIWIDMPALSHDVGVQVGRRRFGTFRREFRRHVDDRAHVFVERLQLFVTRLPARDQPLAVVLD